MLKEEKTFTVIFAEVSPIAKILFSAETEKGSKFKNIKKLIYLFLSLNAFKKLFNELFS